MSRSLVLGNGRYLLNFDDTLRIRDLYYPHLGIHNHTEGHPFRIGVWVDGQTHWVDGGWQREIGYEPGTLVARSRLRHAALGLELVFRDAVDFELDVFCREAKVRDLRGAARGVRLFFHQDFSISGNEVGDTALYDPELRSVLHYKRDRYFLIGGGRPPEFRLGGWATGKKRHAGAEGTWRDAERDGVLSGNPIEQGAVDSTVSLDLELEAGGEAVVHYWIAAGERYGDMLRLDEAIRSQGPGALIERTASYWRLWLEKDDVDYAALGEQMAALYRTSLLVIRTHMDPGGAIIAAADSDIAHFARDTYTYLWPRDGALVAEALDRARFPSLARRFFDFAGHLIKKEGYFLHKYHPDRSLASSWHPWLDERGRKVLPIQEDETALVVWALWRHFERSRDVEAVQPLYRPFLLRAADFLCEYRDPATGLPKPSWDLWEERRGVLTFTCAAVWAGLDAAARFARAFGDAGPAARFAAAADEVRAGILQHLWDEGAGRFVRMAVWPDQEAGQAPRRDPTPDASLFGLHFLGLLEADDPRMTATAEAVIAALSVRTPVGGLARYLGDYYHAATTDWERVPGNPWFIGQCWHARWRIAQAGDFAALDQALDPLRWVLRHALPSGLLPEQVHPFTGEPLSVTPLVWSHAAYVTAVHDYLDRLDLLRRRAGRRASDSGVEHGLH